MATGKGVMRGSTGVTTVDAHAQLIVDAQAHGTGSEQEVLLPVVRALQEMPELLTARTVITADAGYHSEANLKALAALNVEALIADSQLRQRDARFVRQDRHRRQPDPLYDKADPSPSARSLPLYGPSDFTYDPAARTCVCPAGKSLYRKGRDLVKNGYLCAEFRGAKRDCLPCTHRARCLRHPETTPARQVIFIRGQRGLIAARPPTHSARMRARLDSAEGRAQYGERFGTVEPVFANLCDTKGLTRFTLRGRTKVDGQWKLFCLVHHIEKLAHHGYTQ